MSLVYAPRGLVGVLTPQANTTVEPELQLLCPPGLGLLSARMTSPARDLRTRLIDYYQQMPRWLDEFANAPLQAIACACTGSSYLIGRQLEGQWFADFSRQAGRPVTNSALATLAALQALKSPRVALISPYPPWLTEASQAYWESQGLQIRQVLGLQTDPQAFHPIYALRAEATEQALEAVDESRIDAVLFLGTGTPTLSALARRPLTPGGKPVLSCNLALLWFTLECVFGHQARPRASALRGLLMDRRWRAALTRLRPGRLAPTAAPRRPGRTT